MDEEEGPSLLEQEQEINLRLQCLHLAVSSSTPGLLKEEVVARSEAFLNFVKGTQTNA